jgi:hypothetical protein
MMARLSDLQHKIAQVQGSLKESMKIQIMRVKKRRTEVLATASVQNATQAILLQEFKDQGWQATQAN